MHELSIAQAIVEEVARVAAREGAARVVGLTVAVGGLSGVEPEALRFAFPLAAAGTIAADARLVVETAPVLVRCRGCGGERPVECLPGACPACQGNDVDMIGGSELTLRSIEVEGG